MNIAFFSKHLPSDEPNGVSVQVDRLARALCGRGHAVTCFSFSPRPHDAPYALTALRWNGAKRLRRKFQPAFAFRKMCVDGFDIAHYHGDDWLCPGSRKRVRTFYGSALFEALHAASPGRFLYQAFFYKLEWLSCLRRGALACISAATRRGLPLVHNVIPCGVPLDRFSPDPAVKTPYPSILFIGDFNSRKRGSLLVRVFRSEIMPLYPGSQLTVVGPEKIEAPNVRCLGRISEESLISEYRKAWVYCLPSSYEGFGVPAIEAMACGTAVVATRNAGIAEIVTHEKNGLVCDKNFLGPSLLSVIKDENLRSSLITNGLNRAKDFDILAIARRYEQIYNTLIHP
jgi:glycosyltransferase involved in cell wall biosynthesis